MDIKGLYQKHKNGDMLTNAELETLNWHMTEVEKLLSPLGAEFKFCWIEASSVARETKGYMNARCLIT